MGTASKVPFDVNMTAEVRAFLDDLEKTSSACLPLVGGDLLGPLNIFSTLAIATDGEAGTSASDFNYNRVSVSADTKEVTGGNLETRGFYVELETESTSGTAGQKIALNALVVGFSSGALNTGGDLIGTQSRAICGQANGGTNLGAGAKGTLYGLSGQGHAFNGAINYLVVSGGEYDAIIDTGGSAKHRWGLSVVGNGQVQGSSTDAALEIGAVPGGGAHNMGILFDSAHGAAPLATTATILGTDGTAFTVTNGIDFRAITFTGNQFIFNIASVVNAVNDAAAAGAGVPVGGVYRNGSVLMVRVV